MDGATGYMIYRGGTSGDETLLKTIVGATTTYTDDATDTPDGSTHPPSIPVMITTMTATYQ